MPALGISPTSISPSASGGKPTKAESRIQFQFHHSKGKLHRNPRRRSTAIRCRASSSSSSSIADYDLYALLGIDSSSDQSEIKNAYRKLQKRCHPDIAGPPGHDMAIVLNDVYSLLSNPTSRAIYDKEQSKMAEIKGYTGKPLYSAWFGSEDERRAVFVDEVKCVGCLKCALFASKTFAIESVYGRARVVAQWADPENTILDAIQTCPVDCISIVKRSELAALEFLMSKQPRGNVRMSAGNAVGARVSNVFAEVEKLQSKYNEMKETTTQKNSKEHNLQREIIISAMQGIRSISNWWYWQAPKNETPAAGSCQALLPIPIKAHEGPDIDRLREIAARRQSGEMAVPSGRNSVSYKFSEEYWTPTLVLQSPSDNSDTRNLSTPSAFTEKATEKTESAIVINKTQKNELVDAIPSVVAAVAEIIVGLEGGQTGSGLKEHLGGSTALELVNSFGLQILLTGITWYLIAAAVVGSIKALFKVKLFRR